MPRKRTPFTFPALKRTRFTFPALKRTRFTFPALKRTRFTLIELLVVTVIILILMSLLLPSLRRAREAAEVTVCKNSLSQLARAVHLYESDFSAAYAKGMLWNGSNSSNGTYMRITHWNGQTQGASSPGYSTWYKAQIWYNTYVNMQYLLLPSSSDNSIIKEVVSSTPITDSGAEWLKESLDYAIETVAVGAFENNALQYARESFKTYPYFVRAGGVYGGSATGWIDGFGYRANHPAPERSMITHCPARYHHHAHGSNGTLGYGWITGSHYMEWAISGCADWSSGGNSNSPCVVGFLQQTWGGGNVAMGDGHVEYVRPQQLVVRTTAFEEDGAGEWSAAITKWDNHGYAIQLLPGGIKDFRRDLVNGE